jgi:hypothetical protein
MLSSLRIVFTRGLTNVADLDHMGSQAIQQ